MESAVEDYNDFFRNDRFAENHQQEFTFVEIEGKKHRKKNQALRDKN